MTRTFLRSRRGGDRIGGEFQGTQVDGLASTPPGILRGSRSASTSATSVTRCVICWSDPCECSPDNSLA